MSIKNELSLEEDKDFIEEDDRSKVIKELTDDEEIDAAIDLLKEKYDTPDKDTVSDKLEPAPAKEQIADTSKESEDKTKLEQKPASEDKKPEPVKPVFILTDEVINKQPEEYKGILDKYKGKGKADLAKAAANAMALKNDYLKDNQVAIDAVASKIETGTDEEVLKTLIESEAKVGVTEPTDKSKIEPSTERSVKIELPTLPEDDEVNKILNLQTAKRLKKSYPDMPEDMSSEEYREWEKDLLDSGGLSKANNFLKDLDSAQSKVKNELQKVIYAQTNLKNLYNESPAEIIPILTDENLPQLKRLNDDYRSVNNKSLEEEVGLIKKELDKFGVTEKDLGIDLTLAKDQDGSLINKGLNELMFNGDSTDPNIISLIGKVPVLRKGQLVKKFIFENNAAILTALVNNKSKVTKTEVEKLKSETLNTLGNSKGSGTQIINADDVSKITDDTKLDKLMSDIKSKY